MTLDNEDEYEKVMQYCNRLFDERRISLYEKNDEDGKIMYSIKFYQPEWFSELNDDLQYCIVTNIQNYFTNNLHNYIRCNRKRKFGE